MARRPLRRKSWFNSSLGGLFIWRIMTQQAVLAAFLAGLILISIIGIVAAILSSQAKR